MSSVPRADTKVWFISDDAGIPDKTGVYCDRLTNDYQKTLTITSRDQDWIPYVAVDANSASGVYLGWEWSNGRIAMAADKTPTGIVLKAGNRDDFRTDLSAGETFEVPPGFLGAYSGDIDDCGNSVRGICSVTTCRRCSSRMRVFPRCNGTPLRPRAKGKGVGTRPRRNIILLLTTLPRWALKKL